MFTPVRSSGADWMCRPGRCCGRGWRLLAEPAGGLVADLPPARPGRADLRRPGRDHLGHRAGHRPAQQPRQTLGLGTATATAPTPPTALYLPALRNEALLVLR